MFTKIFTIFTVMAITFSAFSQNARIDALGGCSIVPDVISILKSPANVNDYNNVIQGTAYGINSFGPVIGVKSVGDMFSLGIFSNTTGQNGSSVLRGDFYHQAVEEIKKGDFDGEKLDEKTFPTIPHILFGVDFGTFKLGADLFFEGTTNKFESEITDDSENNETKIASIKNIGGLFNFKFDFTNFSLSPIIGIGAPSLYGEYKEGATIVEAESEKSLFFKIGTDSRINISDKIFGAGFFFTTETIQFKNDKTLSRIRSSNFIDLHLGFSTEILNRFLLASQYDLSMHFRKRENEKDKEIEYKNTATHTFRGGLEAELKGFWIFDRTIPRAGLIFNFDNVTRINEEPNSTVKINEPASAKNFAVTTGLGVTKGIVGFDLNVELGNWDGIFTGPEAVSASITLDFNKIGGSHSINNESENNSTSAPDQDVESVTEPTEDNKKDFDF